MSNEFADFTTFNHINDYGEQGYAALEREIASSHPLVLWAPSMALLEQCYNNPANECSISPERFIRYVENGYVRVIGRQWWLFEKEKREKRAETFQPAIWTRYDDQLLAIARNDANLPDGEARVRNVEDEEGFGWARRVIEEERRKSGVNSKTQPPLVRDIVEMIRRGQVPTGTAEQAMRQPTPEQQALHVLRDVKNHTDAYHQADGEGFIMAPEDSRFLQLLEKNRNFGTTPATARMKPELENQVRSAKVEEAILGLLERLSYQGRRPSFDQFIESEAHRALVFFTSQMHGQAKSVKLKALDRYVRERLFEQIQHGMPRRTRWSQGMMLTIAGFIPAIGITATGYPATVTTLAGVGISAIQLTYRALQRIGLIADSYSGPQWPFLYAFSRRARRKDYSEVLGRLWSNENE